MIGFIETGTDTAKRNVAAPDYDDALLKQWAEEQFSTLMGWPLTDAERFHAGAAIARFKIDSRPLARLLVYFEDETSVFLTFDNVVETVRKRPLAIYKSRHGAFAEAYNNFRSFPGATLIRTLGNVWHRLEFNADGTPVRNFSMMDLIHRTALEKGLNLKWRTVQNVRPMDVVGYVDAVVATVDT